MPKEWSSSNQSRGLGLKQVDKVQLKIIAALKDCHLDRIGAMNALLSIALSIAEEEEPTNPISVINDSLAEIQDWQDPIFRLLR